MNRTYHKSTRTQYPEFLTLRPDAEFHAERRFSENQAGTPLGDGERRSTNGKPSVNWVSTRWLGGPWHKARATRGRDPQPNRLRTSRPEFWKCPCNRAGVKPLPLSARFLRGERAGGERARSEAERTLLETEG